MCVFCLFNVWKNKSGKSDAMLCCLFAMSLLVNIWPQASSVNCSCSPLCNHDTLIGWPPVITPRSMMSLPSSTQQSCRGSTKAGGSRRLQEERLRNPECGGEGWKEVSKIQKTRATHALSRIYSDPSPLLKKKYFLSFPTLISVFSLSIMQILTTNVITLCVLH